MPFHLFALIAIIVIPIHLNCQIETVPEPDSMGNQLIIQPKISGIQIERIYSQVEKPPQFPAGLDSLYRFIAKNITYPKNAMLKGVQGTVYIDFIINKEGKVKRAKVKEGIGWGCDQEAMKSISQLPKWKPALIDNKPVSIYYTLPVRFRLKSDESTESNGDEPKKTVETMPEFPGGTQALYKSVYRSIRYPEDAKENNIEGTVYVQFIVNEDGNISDVEVQKGLGFGLDEEAIRCIKILPKWKPGFQDGVPVKVIYNMPIRFSLN